MGPLLWRSPGHSGAPWRKGKRHELSGFLLAVAVALIFALVGFFYLVPGVYHPFSADTFDHTTPHIKHAGFFLVLAVAALVASRYLRPAAKQ